MNVNPGHLLAFLLALVASSAPDEAADFDSMLAEARSARLEPSRAVRVSDLQLDLGRGRIWFEDGVFIPATEVAGGTREVVFVGRARFSLEPPDAVERGQLFEYTGMRSLSVTVDRAVFVAGNESEIQKVLSQPAAPDISSRQRNRATELFRQWRDSEGSRPWAIDEIIVMAASGDGLYRDWSFVWCDSPEVGAFGYEFAPAEHEPVRVFRFEPPEESDGRWKYEQWLTATNDEEPRHGGPGVAARHYDMSVTVVPDRQRVEARVSIDLDIQHADLRFVTLELAKELHVNSIHDGGGRKLQGLRSGRALYVALAEPVPTGERVRLTIDCGGEVLDELFEGYYRLRSPLGWYPSTGFVDRATYDMTFIWPKDLELLASGQMVMRTTTAKNHEERRKLDVPAAAVSFEIGRFEIIEKQVGHVFLRAAFSLVNGQVPRVERDDVIDTLRNALVLFEREFGTYPLDELTVVTVPGRSFSQGPLSFITLTHKLVERPGLIGREVEKAELFPFTVRENRIETVAHELAHQWWGNRVGWLSYRDQWLSEALADYSAVLFTSRSARHAGVKLSRRAQRWRQTLSETIDDGRMREAVGPVTLGTRLITNHSHDVYSAVVYDKGSVVFTMMARLLGEEPFLAMMKALSERVNNRLIDTETFIKAVEHMSGRDLTAFANRYIYGTGLPSVYYDYQISPRHDGGWMVEGHAVAHAASRGRSRIVRDEAEAWNFVRVPQEQTEVDLLRIPVPFQVAFDGGEDGRTRRGVGGTLELALDGTQFRIPLEEKPFEFWLDQRGEILANFFCRTRQPKQMDRQRALELLRAGRRDEALALLGRGLESPALGGPAAADVVSKDLEWEALHQDVALHLALSRLHLDAGQDDLARQALETAESALPDGSSFEESTRLVLRCWLEIRNGHFKLAYNELSKLLGLRPRQRQEESYAIRPERRQAYRDADAYALLALAAYETGRREVAEHAVEEARRRGADMTILVELMQES